MQAIEQSITPAGGVDQTKISCMMAWSDRLPFSWKHMGYDAVLTSRQSVFPASHSYSAHHTFILPVSDGRRRDPETWCSRPNLVGMSQLHVDCGRSKPLQASNPRAMQIDHPGCMLCGGGSLGLSFSSEPQPHLLPLSSLKISHWAQP